MENGPKKLSMENFEEAYDSLQQYFQKEFNDAGFINRCSSILWFLADATNFDQPEGFLRVWDKIKDKVPMSALLVQAKTDNLDDKGICVLWLLAEAARKNNQIKSVVIDILAQMPGEIPKNILSFYPKGVCGDEKLLSLHAILDKLSKELRLVHLINCRNDFFKRPNQRTARDAEQAGYVNAHYDLGHHFAQLGDDKKADEAYLKLSIKSPYYDEMCIGFCKQYFFKGLFGLSLKWALNIQAPEIRAQTIQAVAASYIYDEQVTNRDVVPTNLLRKMNSSSEVEWCEEFMALKEKLLLEQENEMLKLEIVNLNQKLAAKEHLIKKQDFLIKGHTGYTDDLVCQQLTVSFKRMSLNDKEARAAATSNALMKKIK